MSRSVVVITGAASGIGRSLVKEYLKRGAKVAAIDCNEDALSKLQKELKVSSEHFLGLTTDVSDEEAVVRAGAKVTAELGMPTHWFNNAGITAPCDFLKQSSHEFDRIMRVNFQGVVYGTRTALRAFNGRPGVIVNMASVAGSVALPFVAAYTASKHAVVGFTRAVRQELKLAGNPAKLVMVAPGIVRTPIIEERNGIGYPKWLEWLYYTPEQVAQRVLKGLDCGESEISPTRHGSIFLAAQRFTPRLLPPFARLTLATNWREALGLTPIRK